MNQESKNYQCKNLKSKMHIVDAANKKEDTKNKYKF